MTQEVGIPAPPVSFDTGSQSPVIRLNWHARDIDMYWVYGEELDHLADGATSPYGTFLGLSGGGAITAFATLLSAPLPDRIAAAFVASAIVTSVLSILFLWLTVRDLRESRRRIQRIREARRSFQIAASGVPDPIDM